MATPAIMAKKPRGRSPRLFANLNPLYKDRALLRGC
jgi:hypothetical protein